ncbi:MAG: Dabb family protein [Verrucomicrobiales bacterium]|jgi:hypothetical protein|nr:Dabb family protein [Verrucomicrobiales bacterium]
MVHHIRFLKLKANTKPDQIENLMVETRIRLLKIPEIMNLYVGKRIDSKGNPHDVFFSLNVENMAKLRIAEDDAVYIKFKHQILDEFVEQETALNFEMEPGKDVTYS